MATKGNGNKTGTRDSRTGGFTQTPNKRDTTTAPGRKSGTNIDPIYTKPETPPMPPRKKA